MPIKTSRATNVKCLTCGMQLTDVEISGEAYDHAMQTGHTVMVKTTMLVIGGYR